jgi:hypothetical protein
MSRCSAACTKPATAQCLQCTVMAASAVLQEQCTKALAEIEEQRSKALAEVAREVEAMHTHAAVKQEERDRKENLVDLEQNQHPSNIIQNECCDSRVPAHSFSCSFRMDSSRSSLG